MDRIVGTAGVIEVGVSGANQLPLRIKRDGQTEWEAVDTKGESIHGPGFIDRAIADIIDAQKLNPDSKFDVIKFEHDNPTVVIPRKELAEADRTISSNYGVTNLVNIRR